MRANHAITSTMLVMPGRPVVGACQCIRQTECTARAGGARCRCSFDIYRILRVFVCPSGDVGFPKKARVRPVVETASHLNTRIAASQRQRATVLLQPWNEFIQQLEALVCVNEELNLFDAADYREIFASRDRWKIKMVPVDANSDAFRLSM